MTTSLMPPGLLDDLSPDHVQDGAEMNVTVASHVNPPFCE
jgi:hypothetical protein